MVLLTYLLNYFYLLCNDVCLAGVKQSLMGDTTEMSNATSRDNSELLVTAKSVLAELRKVGQSSVLTRAAPSSRLIN